MTIIKKKQEFPVFGDVLSNLFEERFFEPLKQVNTRKTPAVNIFENETEFKIQLASPGMKKSDFDVDVTDSQLTISAEISSEKNEQETNYSLREFNYSKFSRTFTLPKNCKTEEIGGQYTDGILEITIPKITDSAKGTKKIEIK